MGSPDVHTEGNAVPSLNGTELGGLLEDLASIHPGIDLIRDGLRLLALDRHTTTTTQLLIASLAGSPDALDITGAIGHLVARLTNPDTNPGIRHLPTDQQKTATHQGWLTAHNLTDPDLRTTTSHACAALDH